MFRFFIWSLRTTDWAAVSGIVIGVSVIAYSAYDYQQNAQKQEWMPRAMNKPNMAGRFGQSFPENPEQYKKESKKQMTLEELEWNLEERERRYAQFMKENKDK